MFKLIDFNSWKVYDGASEGSGRSEKVWLISEEGEIGLFKYPKIDPVTNIETTEHISEHLAYQLGCILEIPTAKVALGFREGRVGSMSYLVRKENETLIEGINFISGRYPRYNAEKMQNEEDGTYYCIDHILNSIPPGVPNKIWIEMMLFDYLIGNTDRHQSNWALLVSISMDEYLALKIRRCPLYDNGSSLCCYVNETLIEMYENRDVHRFKALVDSKSKSIIRIDGTQKKCPKHSDVIRYLLSRYSVARTVASRFVESLDEETINGLLNRYPADILSEKKNLLIRRYLFEKIEILKILLKGEVDNDGKEE